LLIGGDGVARGYFNRPDVTAERFIPDPFSSKSGARLYKTGDLARHLPDGNIEFLGRNDDQVKIRGFRIELGEIEEAINCCAGIKEAIVVACDDKQGGKRLVAFVIAEDRSASAASQLRSSLRERLPEHMIPAAFVSIDELPMTPNGKADRRALIARAETEAETEGAFSPAATAIEEILAGIYAETLNLGRVSANGNFFELGGHSLLATRLLSRVREGFQVELQLRTVFEAPTVSALAAEIERAIKSGDGSLIPPMTRAPRDTALPMSFAQQRLWFLNQLEPDAPIYNDPSCVRLVGYLDVEALGKTFSEIARRHEILRTSFCLQNGSPVQSIAPAQPLPFPIIDLSALDESGREAEAARLMPIEASRLFDLATGPMIRVSLVRFSERIHLVFLTMHHIITDGWSAGIIVREIATLYEAFSQGKPSPLPELPLQYADFAHWQREWLQGEALEAQVAYWKQKLSGAPELLDLPTDRPRPPARSLRGEQQTAIINSELYEGLRSLSRNQGATLFMTLLAAFKTLLYRYSEQSDLCIGTPIAGRNRLETEGLIGFFVNTLVLRTDLSGDPSFCDLLGRVRETTLGAYAHQDLPFEKIVEEMQPQRSASYTPMFQVMFALENVPAESLEAQGLTLEPVQGKRETSKFDMALYLHETGPEMLAVLEYSSDLFESATAVRLLAQYEALLGSIITDPQRRLSELSLSAEADRNRLLLDFNEEFAPVEFAS
jgi:acyl carrier protein